MNLGQQLLNGLVLGHAYALIAIGWTVLLGVARLVNFAHGQMYMVGAFVAWAAMAWAGLPYPLALAGAVLVGIALGFLMQEVMLGLTLRQDLVSIMIVTLGFGYVLHGVAALAFGSTGQILDTPFSTVNVYWNDIWFTGQDLLIIGVTVGFFAALQLVLARTRLGRLARMVAEDPQLAILAGIDVRRVYFGVFAFQGAAVGLAGAIVGPRTPILTSMGFEEVIVTFVVVVLGGIGSVLGSYLAGLSLGMFTALFGAFVSPAYTTPAAFVVLIAVLMLRPGGLAAKAGST